MAISPWFELFGFFDSDVGGTDGEPVSVDTGGNAETEVGSLDPASDVPVIDDLTLDVSVGSGTVLVVHEAVDRQSPSSPMTASGFLPK
ncbi:hypothetical protein CQ011_03255 [Arthrobacter sp. MYb213]|nr:hypothetical protein CQ011_03255 [Arthrobacter sp. MYb213]